MCKGCLAVGNWRRSVCRRTLACGLQYTLSHFLSENSHWNELTSTELACHGSAARGTGHVIDILVRVVSVTLLLAGASLRTRQRTHMATPLGGGVLLTCELILTERKCEEDDVRWKDRSYGDAMDQR